MGRRFSRIVAMRIAAAAMRWLGIHAPAPAIGTSKLTFDTSRSAIDSTLTQRSRTSPDVPPQRKQKL
jgi:hypothetical protein